MTIKEKKIFSFPSSSSKQGRATLAGLQGSAAALCALEWAQQHNNFTLLLCSNFQEAQNCYRDLLFFSSLSAPKSNALDILHFPGWEFSPYKKLLPNTKTRLDRLRCLYKLSLQKTRPLIIVSSIQALVQKTIPLSDFIGHFIELSTGVDIDKINLLQKLPELGYQKTDPVEDPATHNMHGGILDIFSPAHTWPARIDLFDTEIEQLRLYNPSTQRSMQEQSLQKYFLIPSREMLLTSERIQLARLNIKEWSDENNIPKKSRDRLTDPLNHHVVTQEMDYLHPFFQKESAWLWDYFPEKSQWISLEESRIKENLEIFLQKQQENFESCLEKKEIAIHPKNLFANKAGYAQAQNRFLYTEISSIALSKGGSDPIFSFTSEPVQKAPNSQKKNANFNFVTKNISDWQEKKYTVFFVANSQSQLDRFSFLLAENGIKSALFIPEASTAPSNNEVCLLLGNINNGFILTEQKIVFLSEDEIFGKKDHLFTEKTQPSAHKTHQAVNPLDELSANDLVVHVDHGIGRYKGLVKLSPDGVIGDYVFLEYANNDKLYLPIYRLELIQKYISANSSITSLDKLGSQQFLKTKEKVKASIKDIAATLIKIHAERSYKKGYSYSEPDNSFREFEASFPYDETPDQLKAIRDTINDMCSEKPMDRLVCGDVGFGKTEVAIRAALKASQDGKQTAVLVPTTILAEQHYQTFAARFKEQAINIVSLSRFRSKQEQKKILEELKSGKIDIVIGTHRLLSKDVAFNDLGLLVIDEEQRFGVEHKERLKQIRATTDVLTLTATPIPRTLHLALMGIRDISLIHTAPTSRLSIKTHIAIFDPEVIKTAIESELSRGGQVFFIHNRVQSINKIYELLRDLLPQAKIAVAHGQMPSDQLEKVMLDFYERKADILLATTIIENGLDVANANTIIINRADTFGLAQLYQIRGRVGRSQTRAYAYLLIPENATITDDARERLSILQRLTELGSGYAIASHDLELRGGGDILGDAQSGHINLVGYDLYLELLEEEVLRLRGEEKKKKEDIEIHCPFPAFLPDTYISDVRSRLNLYKRLSSFSTEEEVKEAESELLDRYGPLPPPAWGLLWLLQIKVLLRRFGFRGITIGKHGITIQAGSKPIIELSKLLSLIEKEPERFSISPDHKLTIRGNFNSLKSVYDDMRQAIQGFAIL